MLFRNKDTDHRISESKCFDRFLFVRKQICVLLPALVVAAFIPISANAGEVDELKAMIKGMEQRHQQEMMELRQQVEQLTNQQQPPAQNTNNELDGRVERLEQKVEKVAMIKDSGFTSPKDWHFDLGGELEFEFVKTDDETGPLGSTSEPDPHFQIDQLYLYPKVTYKDFAVFSADIAIKSSSSLIEEAWARFYGIPYNTFVEVGLNDPFIANINRKTEAEILIETAFYRNDDMGVTVGGEPVEWLYWKTSITNGLALGTKQPSEDSSFPIISDSRNPSNANDQLMLAAGVGFEPDLGPYGRFEFLPYYYNGSLSSADISFLQAIPGYGASTDDDKTRYGFNFRYDIARFTFIGQLLEATDGTLDRTGWFAQPSYLIPVEGRDRFNAYELVYRYNNLQVDLPNVVSNSLTWDREQHVFALLIDIFQNTKLKLEYYVNDEETGGAEVDNNEFMTQVEVKW